MRIAFLLPDRPKKQKKSCRMSLSDYLHEHFTGTLPVNNLNEALEVLDKSFHLRASVADTQIVLAPYSRTL